MMSRTVSVLSWEADTESARSNDGSAASFPEINARSTESSEETCSAGPNETAEHPCGDRRNYELGTCPRSSRLPTPVGGVSDTVELTVGHSAAFSFHDAGFIVGSNVINHDVSPMIPKRVAHGGSHSHR